METAPRGPHGLEAVFIEHQRRIFRAAYRITGSAADAEDVLQTVFLRLARKAGGVPPVDNLSSYLYRSAVNAALDVLRDRKEKPGIGLDMLDEIANQGRPDAPDRQHEASELRSWLRRAMGRLSPQAAEVFALRYLEGHGNRDIARMLGVSRIAVAVMLHRTRKRLRDELRTWTGGYP